MQDVLSAGSVAGYVAVLGPPNAGKSTLINALLGEKVSIVSPKPQTTRQAIRGILNRPGVQMVLVDTPGFCAPSTPLHRAMRKAVGRAAAAADVSLVVLDIGRHRDGFLREAEQQIIEAAKARTPKLVLALNKVDLLENPNHVLPWIDHCAKAYAPCAILPMAARRGEGLTGLVGALQELLPPGPPLFSTDMYTDRSEKFLCAELIREQLLYQTHQEVPHTCAVTIEEFRDGREQTDRPARCALVARIYVARDSQKGIVVGQGGQQIKNLGCVARQRIGQLLGCPTDLRLSVHVDPQWPQSEPALRRYGLLSEAHPC
jgi:GTP-binding protein Era